MPRSQQDPGRIAGFVGGIGVLAATTAGILQEALLNGVEFWLVLLVLALAVFSAFAETGMRWWRDRSRLDPGLSAARRAAVIVDRQAGGTAGYGFLVDDRHVVTTSRIVNAALGHEGDAAPLNATVLVHWESDPDRDHDAGVVASRQAGAGAHGVAVLRLDKSQRAPRGAAPLAAGAVGAGKRVTVEVWDPTGRVKQVSGTAVQVRRPGEGGQVWCVRPDPDAGAGAGPDAGSAAGLAPGEIDGAPVVRTADNRVVGIVVDTSGDDILFVPVRNNPAYDGAIADAKALPLAEIAQGDRRGRVGLVPAGAVVVALAFTVYALSVNGVLPVLGPAACEGEHIEFNVTVSTEKDALIDTLADRFAASWRSESGRCALPYVSGVSSGQAKAAAAESWATPPDDELHPGKAVPEPDLWLPTSSVWADLLEAEGHDAMLAPAWEGEMASVTSSVLGILMTEQKVKENFPDRAPTWRQLVERAAALDGGLTLALDDPVNSTSGMANSVALNEALRDVPRPQKVNMLRAAVASVPEALAGQEITHMMNRLHEEPGLLGQMDVVVAQEQTAYLFNCRSPLGEPPLDCAAPRTDPREKFVVVQPADGTYAFDHPAILMKGAYAGNDSEAKWEAAKAFVAYLTTQEAQDEFERWGFRSAADPAGVTSRLADVTAATRPVSLSPWPAPTAIAEYQEQWQSVRLPVQVHLAIDNSGSMTKSTSRVPVPGFVDPCDGEPSPNPTYLQLAQQAALNAVERLDDGRDSVALDAFPRPEGWKPVPLTTVDAGVRADLRAAVCAVDGLGGTTPLYAAIEGAQQRMIEESREEGASSSTAIVVLSDGAQVPAGDLGALLESIEGETAVPVISVAIGPDAPIEDLEAIRDTTGGAVRDLRRPAAVGELDTVLVDVFSGLTGK